MVYFGAKGLDLDDVQDPLAPLRAQVLVRPLALVVTTPPHCGDRKERVWRSSISLMIIFRLILDISP